MTINVTQQTTPLEATAYYWTNKTTGQKETTLEFLCTHENYEVDEGDGVFSTGIWCPDCRNEDLSDDQVEGMLGY